MDKEKSTIGVAIERFEQLVCSQCECPIDIRDVAPFTRIECPQCRHAATVPAKLGHFLLLDLIGTGGMGSVYIAEDEALDRLVAIKVMLESLGKNAESVEKFKLEAQAAARLNHPNIAQIYSIGQERGQPYIVMELVNGHGIESYIAQGKPVNQGLAVKVGLDIAEALKAADEAGLMHGDIKPENILVDDKGRTKLVDFGLASLANQAAGEGIWGTPYYIAPERVRRQKVDLRSDIYSLGATLYHAIAAKPPFDGETPAEVVKARLDKQAPPLSTIVPNIHPQVEGVVSRMLQTDPMLRHPTYASLISDLKKALDVLPRADRFARLKLRAASTAPCMAHLPRVAQHIDEAGGEPTGARPKILIKSAKARIAAPSPAAKAAKTGQSEEDRARRQAARRRRRRRVLATLLFAALAGAAGATAYYVRLQRGRTVAARREYYALLGQRQACTNAYAEVTNAVGHVDALAADVAGYVTEVSNALFVVLATEPDPAVWQALRVEAGVAPAADAELPQAGAGATNAPAADSQTNAPPAGAEAPAAAAAAEPPAEAGANAPPSPAAAEDPAPVETLDIRGLAVRILAAQPVIAQAADELRPLAVDAAAHLEVADRAATSAEAEETTAKLLALVEKATAIRERADAQGQRAQAAAQRVGRLKSAADAEQAAQRRRDEQAARLRAEAEARQAREAEHDALVQTEKGEAELARANCQTLVIEYRFKEAADLVRKAMKSCKTDEGKAAFQLLVDRYRHLASLKAFVVDRLNNEPRPYIWGTGAAARDVISADGQVIRYKGGEAAWKDVSVAQMLRFVNLYTSSTKVRLRDQCTHMLGAAIYCYEFGGEQGAAAALSYRDRAVTICSDLQDEANRLLAY